MVAFVGAKLAVQLVNAVFYLLPNATELASPCSWFLLPINVYGVIRWSCWSLVRALAWGWWQRWEWRFRELWWCGVVWTRESRFTFKTVGLGPWREGSSILHGRSWRAMARGSLPGSPLSWPRACMHT